PDRFFESGLDLFYAGPQWFRNALSTPRITPGARVLAYDRSVSNEGWVGTLSADEPFSFFPNYAPFWRTSTGRPITPTAPNTARVWDGGTSGNGTSWTSSTGVNWSPDGLPTTADTLTLDNSITTVPTSMTVSASIGALSV